MGSEGTWGETIWFLKEDAVSQRSRAAVSHNELKFDMIDGSSLPCRKIPSELPRKCSEELPRC